MTCPGCKKPVDTAKEHVVLTHVLPEILDDRSELTHHWHWPCYVAAGGKWWKNKTRTSWSACADTESLTTTRSATTSA